MNHKEYARTIIENFAKESAEDRYLLIDAVGDLEIKRVLDVGCGAGQELIPFAKRHEAFCVGIDIGEELGEIGNDFVAGYNCKDKIHFVISKGEILPFADEVFDVVICRVALPYMNNRLAIAEAARVLRPGGVYLLKTHAPAFYFGMLKRRFASFSARQYAYPVICLAGGIWHLLTGKQLESGFWKGKEIFQTKGFLKRELRKHALQIKGELPDTNIQTPSFLIVKI